MVLMHAAQMQHAVTLQQNNVEALAVCEQSALLSLMSRLDFKSDGVANQGQGQGKTALGGRRSRRHHHAAVARLGLGLGQRPVQEEDVQLERGAVTEQRLGVAPEGAVYARAEHRQVGHERVDETPPGHRLQAREAPAVHAQ